MNAIEVINVHKSYEEVEAVRGVHFQVKQGELFGLIGPDGAGKTTLMRAICTLLNPDQGRILVQGMDTQKEIAAIRSILGYMPQQFSLYQDLSVEQNLRFFADLFQVSAEERQRRMEQLYRFSRLGPFKKRPAGALSGGMKQKLALSCALIHTPQVLVLDEPTYGVDPVSRSEFWEILQNIRRDGTTILVSTAYMDEADLCDRVALMHLGKVITLDSPANLKKNFKYPLYRIRGKDLRTLQKFFQQLSVVNTTQLFGDALHVTFREEPQESDWNRWQQQSEGNLQQWEPQQPSIEDVFLSHMS
ncbi:MAG: ABC transporter ATP-binding protein [Calditrichaeota bacterium]|nr:MAG: ABC transporter ATP-binding protein [Calditrichota bacterium]